MSHQGGIFATTHSGSFDRVAELITWRGEVSDQRTAGEWTLTATGGAAIGDRDGVTVLLHGVPEVDGHLVPVSELAERWKAEGPEFVRRLHGSYAFVVVDTDANRVHAVRDFMGTKPLFMGDEGAQTSFASEAVAVPVLFGRAAEPDERAIDRYLALYGQGLRRSMVEGVAALPPNTISTVFDTHVVSRSVPVHVDHHELSDDDALGLTRQVLDRAVLSSVAGADERVTAAASAGVDSSVVAVSGLGQGIVDDIVTSRTVGLDEWDEVPRANLIAERFGVPHHVVEVEAPDTFHRITEQIYMHGLGGPTAWLAIATVEAAAAVGSDAFLVGYLGDEWLSLAGGPVAQIMNDGGFRHLLDYLRADVRANEIEPRYVPRYLGRLKANAIRRGTSYADLVLDQFLTSGGLQQMILSLERSACGSNIQLGMPFADRRYVAHVLGLPAWQRNRPGEPKWLLRQAYADLLPEPYVTDPMKANFFDVPSLALDGKRTGFSAIWYQRATWVDAWRQALADRAA